MAAKMAQSTSGTKRPVIVTGATGFIGKELVRKLVALGYPVRALSRSGFAASPVQGFACDITDQQSMQDAMQGVDVIFHLAGAGSPSSPLADAEELYRVNVVGTLNVLEAARGAGVKRVIVTSSASVYGSIDSEAILEDDPLEPTTPYGLAKRAQEQACEMYSRVHEIETVVLRLFSVYGPQEDMSESNRKLIPNVYRRMLNGDPVTVFGDGSQTRDFVHVDDVTEALVLSTSPAISGSDTINIGTGSGTSIADVITTISGSLGVTPRIDFLPNRPGEVQQSVASIKKAEVYGLQPRLQFADGMATFNFPEQINSSEGA